MRYRKLYGIGAAIVLAGALFGLPVLAHAQSFRSGDNITVPAYETVDSTLFSAGRNVSIGGRVNGDVFCAGQTVHIGGVVTGDVICAAQTLTISGTVEGSVRLGAQTVTLSGKINRNATIGAQTFTNNGNIAGDLTLGSQDATLDGMVGRDVVFGGANLIVSGTIGRRLTGDIKQLTVSTGGVIAKGGTYTSRQNARIAGGTQVGDLKRTEPKAHAKHGPSWAFRLYTFAALLLGALVLVLIRPKLFQNASQVAMERPLKTVFIGFVASIVAPVLLMLLLVTVVGIPLGLFLGLVWLAAVVVSGAFSAYYLGRLLLARSKYTNALWYVLLGGAILLLLGNVPILNILVMLASLWFGLGIIVLHCYNNFPRPRYSVQEAARGAKTD